MKPSNQARCEQCGDALDVTAPGNAELASGYLVNRRGGGANMLALPKRRGQWLCRFCLDKRRSGLSWDQLSLFDEA